MKIVRLLLLILALAAIPWSAASDPPTLYSNVPQNHWAYDALQELIQTGLDSGIPDGTYSGRRALTRADFAAATARIAYQGSLEAGVGWPGRPAAFIRKWRGANSLARLAAEFTPEIQKLGLSGEPLEHRLQRFDAVWRTGRPQGVESPLAPHSALDESSQAEGVRIAQDEWRRGAISLYVSARQREPQMDLSHAMPLSVPGAAGDERRNNLVAGHNTEMWRLLRAHPPAPEDRVGWIAAVLDLPAGWRRYGARSLKIDAKHPGAKLPGSDMRLIWERDPSDWNRRSELSTAADGRLVAPARPARSEWRLILDDAPWAEVRQQVSLPAEPGDWRLAWGPRGSGIYLVRTRVKDDAEQPFRLYAVDLRTGGVLNACSSTE